MSLEVWVITNRGDQVIIEHDIIGARRRGGMTQQFRFLQRSENGYRKQGARSATES